jgi:hypothetical protein
MLFTPAPFSPSRPATASVSQSGLAPVPAAATRMQPYWLLDDLLLAR